MLGCWPVILGKVVGTATPKKENLQEKKATWCLSTGDVLTVQWEDRLEIQLENENSTQAVSYTSCTPCTLLFHWYNFSKSYYGGFIIKGSL